MVSPIYLENVSLEDQRAMNEARAPIHAGDVWLLDRTPKSKFLSSLRGEGYSVQSGVLRNPGGMLYMMRGRDKLPLSTARCSSLISLAKEAGVEVIEDNRIPYVFGPDGRTPMIMPSIIEYSPEKYAKIVPMSVEMTFKKVKLAKDAIEYIDPKNYVCKLSGLTLLITFKAPLGATIDERESFDFLAKRFDGKVEWLQSSE